MTKIWTRIILSTCMLIGISAQAIAFDENDVAASFSSMEKALNNQTEPLEKIKILHDMISEDATINVTVDNPAITQQGSVQKIEMNKADYINSFLVGAGYVDNYNADIETLAIKETINGQVTSKTRMKEFGTMLNPYNLRERGKDFVSLTECVSTHGDNAKIISSTCKTQVSYNEAI